MTDKTQTHTDEFEPVKIETYADHVMQQISAWQSSGQDVGLQLIRELELSKTRLDNFKLQLNIDKAHLLLNINWAEVNAARADEGLSKITNESMRKSYLDLKLEEENRELKRLSNNYETLLKIYTHMEE